MLRKLVKKDGGMISGDALWDIYYKIEDLQESVTEQNVYSAKYLGNYLALAGKLYFAQTDTFDIIAGEQYNVSITKGLSEGITGYEVEKTGRYGIVTGISYGSLYIDIDSNTYSVKSLTADETSERMFMLSSGMMSSMYEGLVWEQLTGEKGISTVSIFAQAYDEDIELLGITKDNVEEQLEKLNTDDETKQAVKEAAESGMVVTIPERDVTMGDWTGTGYIVTNPETGEGSYMISGGYNGGTLDYIVTAAVIFSYFLTVLDNAILILSMLPFSALIMASPISLFVAMLYYILCMYFINEPFQEMCELWEIYMETGDIDIALCIIFGTIGRLGGTLLGGVFASDDFLTLLKGGIANGKKPEIDFKINSKQLGNKWGKHRFDYPELSGYSDYEQLARKVFNNPDKIIHDSVNGEYLYIQGNNLLRIKLNGEFVSLYPGASSSKVINAIERGGLLWEK